VKPAAWLDVTIREHTPAEGCGSNTVTSSRR
jgi:hypothetical protein